MGYSDGKRRNEESPSGIRKCPLERSVQIVTFMKKGKVEMIHNLDLSLFNTLMELSQNE
jgi:hypothetical protein